MSTKCSIHYDEVTDLHLYRECLDADPINPVHVEQGNQHGGVHVELPVTALRQLVRSVLKEVQAARVAAAETDAQMETRLIDDVAARAKAYEEWVKLGSPKGHPLVLRGLFGSFQYGSWSDSRNDQLERSRKAAREERDKARAQLAEWEGVAEEEGLYMVNIQTGESTKLEAPPAPVDAEDWPRDRSAS